MAEEGKIWIVFNPTAGKGKAAKLRPKIEKIFKDSGRDFQILLTEKVGHAIEIIHSLTINDDDITVAAGGDGTCNEVVHGLLTRKNRPSAGSSAGSSVPPIFGIIPVGRGNDFAYTPKIPEDIETACKIILDGKSFPLDAGFVKGELFPEGRYFINGIGIGYDTKVGFEAAKMKIKSGLSYMIGALKILIRYEKSPVVQIKFDDNEVTQDCVLISIVNGRRMGGSFYMGPNAILDDGLLDLCYVKHQEKRAKLIKIFSHYTKGTQGELDSVKMTRASKFHLKAIEGTLAAHCDGETICYEGKEFEAACVPGALRLIRAEQ